MICITGIYQRLHQLNDLYVKKKKDQADDKIRNIRKVRGEGKNVVMINGTEIQ